MGFRNRSQETICDKTEYVLCQFNWAIFKTFSYQITRRYEKRNRW